MEIVIKISKSTYEEIKRYGLALSPRGEKELEKALKNGTPLPEHHGKIADLSAVYEDICNDLKDMTRIGVAVDEDWLWAKLNDAIDNAPTIIEANKEVEE